MLDLRLSKCLASGTEVLGEKKALYRHAESAKPEVISLTLCASSILSYSIL